MDRRPALPALLAMVGALAGCGGGASAAPETDAAAGMRVVEQRYASGQLAAQGTVLDEGSTALRQGRWRTWFENGQLRWEGEYRRDAVDTARPWREWNADGSVRDDSGDDDG